MIFLPASMGLIRPAGGASSGYSAAILADSPVLYWRGLGATTSPNLVPDSSGAGANGTFSTVTGVLVDQPSLLPNSDGKSVSLPAGAYVSFGSDVIATTTPTVSAWFSAASVTNFCPLFVVDALQDPESTQYRGLSVGVDAGGGSIFIRFGASGSPSSATRRDYRATLSSAIVADQPYRIVVKVVSGTTAPRVWVGNTELAVSYLSGTATLDLGSTPSAQFFGRMSAAIATPTTVRFQEYAIFNSALDDTRISAHWTAAGGG